MSAGQPDAGRRVALAVVAAAFGYFVDIYDLLLFSILRVPSLRAIGVAGDQLLSTGVLLLNVQMFGMLLGGIGWGMLGDRRGRLSVLFGSISLYSLANIANGFVTTVPMYAALRFVAGVGLAGELGAGITLVSETMSVERRGYGTTTVASFGILGAVAAALVGGLLDWRIAYFVGGAMGLALLALRIGVYESGAFERVARTNVPRGNIFGLLSSWRQVRKYASVILVGLVPWYVAAIPVTFAPEFGQAMGMTTLPQAGPAVMFLYLGSSPGGFLCGYLSERFRSRKRVTRGFILGAAASIALYFVLARQSVALFYTMCFVIGIACGYWAVFMTIAAEQFGTNIRATVATTAPNFVRGAVVPMTAAFQLLRAPLGIQGSALLVGLAAITLALAALANLDETFGRDLNFVEE